MNATLQLRVLIVDDEEIVHETLGDYLEQIGHDIDDAYEGKAALQLIEDNDYDLALIDVRMPGIDGLDLLAKVQGVRPDLSVVIITGHGTMETAIQALRLGAADFLTKPMKLGELDAVVEKAMRIRRLRADQRRLKDTIRFIQKSAQGTTVSSHLIGDSASTEDVRRQIKRAVELGVDTILIAGETGTGKEVVAREIHSVAGGDDNPFIAVSCPALPETLVESELFGHVKGSFTGATEDRTGCFELADGGTLFLDEIADLSATAQAKILRALETRKIRKVGGSREAEVNLCVVAATNVPLEELVKNKQFRQDLYYRLNVFTIKLKPLRERPDDIMPLALHFLNSFAKTRKLEFDGFTQAAAARLTRHDFPGNARELRNTIDRAAVLCGKGIIDISDLDLIENHEVQNGSPSLSPVGAHTEADRIRGALEAAKWNRKEAARLLEMPYSTLRYKIQKYRLD